MNSSACRPMLLTTVCSSQALRSTSLGTSSPRTNRSIASWYRALAVSMTMSSTAAASRGSRTRERSHACIWTLPCGSETPTTSCVRKASTMAAIGSPAAGGRGGGACASAAGTLVSANSAIHARTEVFIKICRVRKDPAYTTEDGRTRPPLPRLVGPARRRVPARRVPLLLERDAIHVRLREIHRVRDDGVDHEPAVAVRLGERVEELLDRGVLAVGDAVLPQVSRPQAVGDEPQVAGVLFGSHPHPPTPRGRRIAPPAPGLSPRRRPAVMQQPPSAPSAR